MNKKRSSRKHGEKVEQTHQETLQALEAALSGAGLRLTHQRLTIYQELMDSHDHPSAEDIYKRVRRKVPTISLDTVYRTLATLEEQGLVVRLRVFEERGRYDADLSPHHHLICSKCKKIADFQWSVFEQADIPAQHAEWGRVMRKDLIMTGICRECLEGG